MNTKTPSSPLKLTALAIQPPQDLERAQAFLADCQQVWIADLSAPDKARALAFVSAQEKLLLSVFESSPFLTRILRTRPDLLALMAPDLSNLESLLEAQLSQLPKRAMTYADEESLMRDLRQTRQAFALMLALADMALAWPVLKVTDLLTRFADICVAAGVDWAVQEARDKGDIVSQVSQISQTGLTILALGKHGAFELNYSSDIDLVAFYEPEMLALKDGLEEQVFYVALVQKLVHILQTPTADGFVFRVDLRLRPDPGSTRVAVSMPAAEIYYETLGQNWERAAYIKARVIAGNAEVGQRFLDTIKPFIWRRNLDFAAIADVHAMKRQIHAVRGHQNITVSGHNIKLGRGGIREIEFFVQTQQLIAGGRDPSLRGNQTCAVLPQLVASGWINQQTSDELIQAYQFFRRVEHRLQMVDDEQTHSLPSQAEKLVKLSRFLGYAAHEDFERDMILVMQSVQTHYANLFENEDALASDVGSLVFTGVQDDPETIETLSRLGFQNPAAVSSQIRSWHMGRFPALRSERARELLTSLMPKLLDVLSTTPDPDFAFLRFEDFLKGLPIGVQPFSLFQSNPHLLSLMVDIIGTAPRLSGLMVRQPAMMDSLLDKDFTDPLPPTAQLLSALQERLQAYDYFEQQLDVVRIWTREQSFKASTQLLAGSVTPDQAGQAFTNLATACVQACQHLVELDFRQQYGALAQSDWAVLAMGKFGSYEMTAASDLDLIMICDAADFDTASEGEKPLSAEVYYARMGRRLISALTVPTSEGALFEVDTRLRPSGNAGALISKFSSFANYQREQAWVWEHMALTRARVIAGESKLAVKIQHLIDEILTQKRDLEKTLKDVWDMHARLRDNFPGKNFWDMKHRPGGLVDIEFIAQALYLCHAHDMPDLPRGGTQTVLAGLEQAGVIKPADQALLFEALSLQTAINHVLKLCLTKLPDEVFSKALENLICQTVNVPSLDRVEAELARLRPAVTKLMARYLAPTS